MLVHAAGWFMIYLTVCLASILILAVLMSWIWPYHKTRIMQLPGYKEPMQFYQFRCPRHGVIEAHPSGYNSRLDCPKCLEELKE